MVWTTLLWVTAPFLSIVHGLNILVFNPTLGRSHVQFLGNIADVLVNDGHNVTILAPVMDPLISNVGHTSSAAHLLPYQSKYLDADFYKEMDVMSESLWDIPVEGRCLTVANSEFLAAMHRKVCRGILEDNEFVEMLRSCRFDVAIHEVYELCAVAIFELIGVKKPVIASAIGMLPYIDEVVGFSPNPSFVPDTYSTYSDEMTFWERMHNMKLGLEMRYRFHFFEKELWSLFNNAHPGFPNLKDLLKQKTGVVLLNTNEFIESPRPTANILRYIGGVAVREAKPLSKELSAVLDKRSQNVLFSFGSIAPAKKMPAWLKKDIISAFESFPNTTFIWKYEDDSDENALSNHPNIYTMKWVPQIDLLGDKRLSLFVTHAGMNSVLEATQYGKPMVAVPLFADQFRNAINLQRRGVAVMISKPDLNKDTLTAALHKCLSDSTIAEKAAKVAKYLSGRPAEARAETSRWVRLAVEGPLDQLILQSRNMSLTQYHNIDVFAYLAAQMVFLLYIVFRVGRFFGRKIVVAIGKQKDE